MRKADLDVIDEMSKSSDTEEDEGNSPRNMASGTDRPMTKRRGSKREDR